MRARFRREIMPEPISSSPSYPPNRFLGDQGLYAYLVQFNIPSGDSERLFTLLEAFFPMPPLSPNRQMMVLNDKGESLRLGVWREFNGIRFDLFTNSASLLEMLFEHPIAPPPPWEAFPRIKDPDTLGSLQGDIEYWWNGYWSPYWDGLTDQQRTDYLTTVGASREWIECIEAHRNKH